VHPLRLPIQPQGSRMTAGVKGESGAECFTYDCQVPVTMMVFAYTEDCCSTSER